MLKQPQKLHWKILPITYLNMPTLGRKTGSFKNKKGRKDYFFTTLFYTQKFLFHLQGHRYNIGYHARGASVMSVAEFNTTEMLHAQNAIDGSESKSCTVEIGIHTRNIIIA